MNLNHSGHENTSRNLDVIVVESQSNSPYPIADALRHLGYKKIKSLPNSIELLQYLELATPNWILIFENPGTEISILQVLKKITETPRLKRIKTSLIIESPEDDSILLSAFELGLMSWHKSNLSDNELVQDLKKLESLISLNKGDCVLVAASFIRQILMENHDYVTLLNFEKNLLDRYPADPKILVYLAESYFLADKPELGVQTLKQITLLMPKMEPICRELIIKHELKGIEFSLNKNPSSFHSNIINIHTVVIIESDTDCLQFSVKILQQLGIENIYSFEDGESAWQWLRSNPEPQFILMGWRLPKLSGLKLLQRIRHHQFFKVSIIIVSSQVGEEEHPLLAEMGVDHQIKKPFDHTQLINTIIWTHHQNNNPNQKYTLELQIRKQIQLKNFDATRRIMTDYLAHPKISEKDKLDLQGEIEFYRGNFARAQYYFEQALKKGQKNLGFLNAYGKALMMLGDNEHALQVLVAAHKICSFNLERILTLVDVYLLLNNTKEAQSLITLAESIDIDYSGLKRARLNFALEISDQRTVAQNLITMESPCNLISFLGNRSIVLAKEGYLKESLELYKRAILALPSNYPDLKDLISFNMGIAEARAGLLIEATSTFKTLAAESIKLREQAMTLLEKIYAFQKSDIKESLAEDQSFQPFYHDSSSPFEQIKDLDFNNLIADQEIRKGDICCHKIFFKEAAK